MTLQASGAISLTNLKDEFGGSSTNIKLSDYAAKFNDGAHITYSIGWNGYHLTLNGVNIPDSGEVIDVRVVGITHDTRVTFLLDSTVTVPVYLRTTYGTDNTNLITTGVSNNGSNYNTSSAYHYGSYTQIHVADPGAALGNDGIEYPPTGSGNYIYLMTNQTQVNSATDSTVAYYVIQVDPETNRNVTMRHPYVDVAFPSSLSGGSEDSLVGGGTYFSLNQSTSHPGIVRNGKSISIKGTCGALSPGPVNGNFNAGIALSIYGYPITLTDSNNHTHGRTFGTFGNLVFNKSVNPISQWTSNSGSGMASFYASQLPTSPTSSSLGSGWSASWSSSGSDLIVTLTNGTGSDYYFIPQTSSNGSNILPWNLMWPGSDFQYYYTQSSNQLNGGSTQRYGQNLFSYLQTTVLSSAGSSIGGIFFLGYHTSNATRAQVIADLLQLYNEFDGQGINSADYRDEGINVGNGYGLQGRSLSGFATEPTTGTLRIHYRTGANSYFGGKMTTTYQNYHTTNVYSGATFGSNTAQGATNFTPTITYDGIYDGAGTSTSRYRNANGNITRSTSKRDIKLSDFYEGKA